MNLEAVPPPAPPKTRDATRGVSKCRQTWTPVNKRRSVASSSNSQSRSPGNHSSSAISIDADNNDYAVSEPSLLPDSDRSQDHVMQGSQSPRTLYNRAPHLQRTMVGDRPWRPGDPQDALCYVCRLHCTSVACSTCPRVYHPQCLTPPLDPFDLPSPWFCPVCVERGWHELELDLTPLSQIAAPADPSIEAPGTFHSHDGNYMRQETNQSVIGPYIEENPSHAVMHNRNFELSAHHDGHILTVDTIAQNTRSEDRARQITPPSPHSPTAVLSEVSQTTRIPEPRANTSAKGRQKSGTTSEGISSGLFTFRVDTSVAQSCSGPTVSASAQQANGARRITTRRSRYSTLPSHLDQSLSALVDELESAAALRDTIQHLESKVNRLEQGLKIQEGQARLTQQEEHDRLRAENASLSLELMSKEEEVHSLRDQKQQLGDELEALKVEVAKRNEDMASWRRIMKTIMHE